MSGRTVAVLVAGLFILSLISPQPSTAVPMAVPKLEMWFVWGGSPSSSGTGTLLRGPNGTVVLFDEGGGAPWADQCKAVMDASGISTVHYAIAGHYDRDHIGGLDDLNNLMGGDSTRGYAPKIDNFYDRGGTTNHAGDPIQTGYYDLVSRSGKRHTVTVDGSSDIDLGGNATLRFLSVGAPNTTQQLNIRGGYTVTSGINENNKSISALITFTGSGAKGGFDLYLGSDLEGTGECKVDDVIVDDFNRKVDIMLVDHHGSESNNISSAEFLNAIDPEVAIISVWHNSNEHPRKNTVERLQQVVEADTQRIIRLAPGDDTPSNPNWAPETMHCCHTTKSTVYVTTDGYFYTVTGGGIDDPDLVNHAVDQGAIVPTPPPPPPPTPESSHLVLAGGDYNGDSYSDIAIFRPSTGLWSVRGLTRVYFGSSSDTPVSGDYNGNGTTNIAIFRPSTGLWAIRDWPTAGYTKRAYFGGSYDTAVPADYNGNGTDQIAIFRPSSGLWAREGMVRSYFGGSYDRPVPGDYTGDGTDRIAVFRPSTGMWAGQGMLRAYFGTISDIPVPGDYADFGQWAAAIFRPSSGMWAVVGITRFHFGRSSDRPVCGDFNQSWGDEVAIFRGSYGLWAIRGVTRAYYGTTGDIPVTR